MKEFLVVFFTGVAIGGANVIPGLSGGTIALIAGVFERLVNAIKNFDFKMLRYLLSGNFKEVIHKLDLMFLAVLFFGILLGILSLARVLGFLFESYPVMVWSYFFGLIFASVFYLLKKIEGLTLKTVFFLAVGVAIAVLIAFATPATQNPSIFYLFLCGAVASSSMIVPGLSGSFMLILMGNYNLILNALNNGDLNILLPVILGIGLGLIIFTKFLSWIIKKYNKIAFSCLTGFVAGSLLILWPWKVMIDSHRYTWFMPEVTTNNVIAIFFMFVGVLSVYFLEHSSAKY
jgi:putative membrane protein